MGQDGASYEAMARHSPLVQKSPLCPGLEMLQTPQRELRRNLFGLINSTSSRFPLTHHLHKILGPASSFLGRPQHGTQSRDKPKEQERPGLETRKAETASPWRRWLCLVLPRSAFRRSPESTSEDSDPP